MRKKLLNLLKRQRNNRILYAQASRMLACLFLAGITVSCEQGCIYHHYQPTDSECWSNRDTLFFEIPVTDTLNTYRIDLEMRNHSSYPFREIFLMVEGTYRNEKGESRVTELICYPLTDSSGKWLGTGWSNTLQSSHPLKYAHFTRSGTLNYKIYHKMNVPFLTGIQDVGMKVTRVSSR